MSLMGYVGYVAKPKNRRVSARKDVNKDAWIVLNGGFAVRPCKLLDMSETGARLSADNAHTIPGVFTLRMSRNNGAPGRAMRVKWRHGSEIGAVFV